MIKKLISVGNNKAVILPSEMVKKYGLEKVFIEDTNDGILIRSANYNSSLHVTIEKLRKYKVSFYKRIVSQANNVNTIKYYAKDANNFSEAGLDMLDE